MDLRNVVEDAMGGFESMAKKIPGYSGYKEKEQRREADALLREHLARELETQWARSNDLRSQMLIGPAMSQLDDMGKASRRLQTLIDKIKAAAQGYAGFFDAVKVKEDQLDALYEFDNDMLLRVDDIADAIDAVQAALDSEENVAPSARRLNTVISELLTLFDKRKDVVTGLY
ncbi:MAG TPA: hypothetical protein G4N96_14375 [Chloroflexi bacterium]|nr:hypothetical protein [Chloroflexota bacterium]